MSDTLVYYHLIISSESRHTKDVIKMVPV